MELISQEILVANEPIKDDAFEIWLVQYRNTKDVLFEFNEVVLTLRMLQQNGIIRKGKNYLHFTYEWNGEEFYFNASVVFHEMNLKYCFYPEYFKQKDNG